MNTHPVKHASLRPEEVRWFEVLDEPINFEVAESIVTLGGKVVALKRDRESVYAVFENQLGPTFTGLWGGCTFHAVVKEW
jgi:hypothetical protein